MSELGQTATFGTAWRCVWNAAVILAHVVANGIVAFWAVATGDWTII